MACGHLSRSTVDLDLSYLDGKGTTSRHKSLQRKHLVGFGKRSQTFRPLGSDQEMARDARWVRHRRRLPAPPRYAPKRRSPVSFLLLFR